MAKETPKPKKPAAKAEKPNGAKAEVKKPAKAAAKPAKAAPAAKPAAKPTVSTGKTAQAAAKTKPAVTKKTAAKKEPAKNVKGKGNKIGKGSQLYCDVCGIVLTVDEACGCADCDIICCGSQMQPRQ